MFKISKEFLIALGISLVLIFPLVFAVPGVSHTPDEINPGTFGGDSTSVYVFPGKVKGTEVCIGDVCKTVWPAGLDSGVITISDGKVGIGIAIPTEKLHIFSQDIVRFVRRNILDGSLSPRCNCDSGSGSGDETNCAIVFPDDGSANTCYDRYKTGNDVAKSIKYTKETESNDVLRVSSLGNVGINGLSNNYRLYVNGEDFAGLYVTTAQQNSYAAYISAPSSSNYGLKVTGYTYIDGNFDVNGDTKITGDLEVTGTVTFDLSSDSKSDNAGSSSKALGEHGFCFLTGVQPWIHDCGNNGGGDNVGCTLNVSSRTWTLYARGGDSGVEGCPNSRGGISCTAMCVG